MTTAMPRDYELAIENDRRRALRARKERVREWQLEIDDDECETRRRDAARRVSADRIADFRAQQAAAAETIRLRRVERVEAAATQTPQSDPPKPAARAAAAQNRNRAVQAEKKTIAMMLAGFVGGLRGMLRVAIASTSAQLVGSKSEGDVALAAAATEMMKAKRAKEREEEHLEVLERKRDRLLEKKFAAKPSAPAPQVVNAPRFGFA